MTDLIDTTEMYLRTFLELEEEGTPLLRARIAERLGHSGPTVSQTVARMERDGLVTVQPDRTVTFSEEGRLRATRVMRKHRLAERLLIDVIGLEYEHVHAEACRWEHVMSDRVERKILGMLKNHYDSPYGNPIPGLEELGEADIVPFEGVLHHLAMPAEQGAPVVLRRIGEPLQGHSEMLTALSTAGVVPGATVIAERDDAGTLAIRAVQIDAEQAVHLDDDEAALLFVAPSASAGAGESATG